MSKKKKPKGKKYNPMAHELSGRKYRQRRVPDKRQRTIDQWMNNEFHTATHGSGLPNDDLPVDAKPRRSRHPALDD